MNTYSAKLNPSLLVLADDLTGAADCAARCRAAGLSATLVATSQCLAAGVWPTDMLAVNADTRHLPSARLAAAATDTLVRSLQVPASTLWYKKIDSTLRGHIGAELDALLQGLERPCAVVCPAFPAHGRGLHNGCLVAPGITAPATDLPALLAQTGRRVVALPLDVVRAGPAVLAERMYAVAAAGTQLLVVDALSDDDLGSIEQATALALPNALRCGSAGWVGAIAARVSGSPINLPSFGCTQHKSAIEQSTICNSGPALLVVGSGSAVARRQIAQLRGQCATHCAGTLLPANLAIADTLLHLPEPTTGARLDGPQARELAAQLAEMAFAAFQQLDPSLLVLVGGDTAAAFLQRLGVAQLTVARELLPGMPLLCGRIAGRERAVVLKAGNHGDEHTLAELLWLARQAEG